MVPYYYVLLSMSVLSFTSSLLKEKTFSSQRNDFAQFEKHCLVNVSQILRALDCPGEQTGSYKRCFRLHNGAKS